MSISYYIRLHMKVQLLSLTYSEADLKKQWTNRNKQEESFPPPEDSKSRQASARSRTPSTRSSARFMRSTSNQNAENKFLITEMDDSEFGDDQTTCHEDLLRHTAELDYARTTEDSIGNSQDDSDGNDTDLEVDLDELLNPDRNIHDTTGRSEYMKVCAEQDVTPASLFIKNIQEREFVMRYRGLGPKGTKALSVPLENNTTIERLDLEGNWIGAQGASHLADCLKENYYITELMIAENMIGNTGAKVLCNTLQDNHTVIKVDISGNTIDDEGAQFVHDMLMKNTTLKHLYLSHNQIEDNGARLLKEVLAENETLESLDLSWNHIRTQGSLWLAQGIEENIGLKYFNMSMNGMALEGAQAMGKALKQNRSLLELDISYNRIPIESTSFIAAGLQANDTLRTLKVGSNPLGEDGAFAILTAIDKNECSVVSYLDLSNIIVTQIFEGLYKQIRQRREFRVVHGGVVKVQEEINGGRRLIEDPLAAFKRDPMTKLKEYVEGAGLRLIDLFKQFDKDQSMTVTREEFTNGIMKARLSMTEEQVDILVAKLDKDGDGEIEYGELVFGDKEHRENKRSMLKIRNEWEMQQRELEKAREDEEDDDEENNEEENSEDNGQESNAIKDQQSSTNKEQDNNENGVQENTDD